MKEYTIEVKEQASRLVTVNAESEDDAIDIVEQQYADGDIVLDYNDYDDVEFEVKK